jgi:hypothetical protein
VRGIGVEVECHVRAGVLDFGIGMGGKVVEQAFDLEVGVVGGFGLLGGDGIDGDVESTAVAQNRKVPVMDWTRSTPALSRRGGLSSGAISCVCLPWMGTLQAWGKCLGW